MISSPDLSDDMLVEDFGYGRVLQCPLSSCRGFDRELYVSKITVVACTGVVYTDIAARVRYLLLLLLETIETVIALAIRPHGKGAGGGAPIPSLRTLALRAI